MKKSALKTKKPLQAKTALKVSDKPKKRKKPEITKLRKLADDEFSRYIRLRDTTKQASGWYGKCITCSHYGLVAYIDDKEKLRFTSGWSAGHFVTRGHLIVRFNEFNVNLQCTFRCNKMRSGEYEKHRLAIKDKFGDEIPEQLEELARANPNYRLTKEYLKEVINENQEALIFLLKNIPVPNRTGRTTTTISIKLTHCAHKTTLEC